MNTTQEAVRVCLHYPEAAPLEHEGPFFEKVAFIYASLSGLEGVAMSDQENADCHIVLLEHYPDGYIRQIVELSLAVENLFCFIPPGMPVPVLILDELRARSPKQCFYTYHDPDDIWRTIERKLGYLAELRSLAQKA